MSSVTGVTVAQVGAPRSVKTSRGTVPTYSFRCGDYWFKTGFKDHGLKVGDVVDFTYITNTFGHQVDVSTIVKHEGGSTVAAPTAAPTGPVPKNYRNGTFPIDPLDGQRSIIRQNALTNARELVTHGMKAGVSFDSAEAAITIVSVARIFEAYTSGDTEADAVKQDAGDKA